MNKKVKLLIKLILFLTISLLLSHVLINQVQDPQLFIEKHNNGTLLFSYIIICILQTIFPIIPGEPIELLGGYIFGKYFGILLCLFGESIASIFIIFIVKKYKNTIVDIIFNKKQIDIIKRFKKRSTFILFTILFTIPGTPKDLLCYASGLTDYDTVSLLIVVTIGRIPSIASSTICAGLLKEGKYLLSVIIYLITFLLCLLDILFYKKFIKNKD